jgi:hypothetical protein
MATRETGPFDSRPGDLEWSKDDGGFFDGAVGGGSANGDFNSDTESADDWADDNLSEATGDAEDYFDSDDEDAQTTVGDVEPMAQVPDETPVAPPDKADVQSALTKFIGPQPGERYDLIRESATHSLYGDDVSDKRWGSEGKTIADAIKTGDQAPELYRGTTMGFGGSLSDAVGSIGDPILANDLTGTVIELSVSSFSEDKDIAMSFTKSQLGSQVPVQVIMQKGVTGLRAADFLSGVDLSSGMTEGTDPKEWITGGKFTVAKQETIYNTPAPFLHDIPTMVIITLAAA